MLRAPRWLRLTPGVPMSGKHPALRLAELGFVARILPPRRKRMPGERVYSERVEQLMDTMRAMPKPTPDDWRRLAFELEHDGQALSGVTFWAGLMRSPTAEIVHLLAPRRPVGLQPAPNDYVCARYVARIFGDFANGHHANYIGLFAEPFGGVPVHALGILSCGGKFGPCSAHSGTVIP